MLKWARAHGCPWHESLEKPELDCCANAAGGGHLEPLQLLRVHDCPWDEKTCAFIAALGGHLESVAVGAGARLPVG